MPTITPPGKTGADAIFQALHKICHVLVKYQVKLTTFIDLLVTAQVITSAEADTAKTFIAAAGATCAVFQKIASYSGISS